MDYAVEYTSVKKHITFGKEHCFQSQIVFDSIYKVIQTNKNITNTSSGNPEFSPLILIMQEINCLLIIKTNKVRASFC